MANPEHVEIVRYGTGTIDAYREENPDVTLDLSGADLADISLQQANLSGANLRNVGFYEVHLEGADFRGADCTEAIVGNCDMSDVNGSGSIWQSASLPEVTLNRVDFSKANLSDADLSGCSLMDADFSSAHLNSTNFTQAQLTRSRFIGCDLSGATVEAAAVTGAVVEDLSGLPVPPSMLWIEQIRRQSGGMVAEETEYVKISGELAKSFFVESRSVDVIWDVPLPDAVLLAYNVFCAACRTSGCWPKNVNFLGGRIHRGEMVTSFSASQPWDVIASLGSLLAPFHFATLAEWDRVVSVMYRGREVSPSAMEGETFENLRDSLAGYLGFATARPTEVRCGKRESKVFYDRDAQKKYDAFHQTGTISIGGDSNIVNAGQIRPLYLHVTGSAEDREQGYTGIRFEV